mgnify:CR=1 FL=1
MRRWLPYPVIALGLLGMWLLLRGSVSAGSILLGGVFAIGGAWALSALEPPRMRFRRPRAALELAWVVLKEIVRSNDAVARIILRPRPGPRTSGFVRIPLDMRTPYGLATLACIITATPGTIWVEYDSADNSMLLHVLDLIDEEEWVRIVKGRYEKPLMEIFQ